MKIRTFPSLRARKMGKTVIFIRLCWAPILPIAMVSWGCGNVKKIESIADKTDEVNSTAREMAEETKKMRQTTEKMREDTERLRLETERMRKDIVLQTEKASAAGNRAAQASEDIYRDSRQGNGLTIRSKKLEEMNASKSPEAKLALAGEFFKAFEFQLWRGQNFDTEKKRHVLFDEAVQSFFNEIPAYIDFEKGVEIESTDNKQKNLMAVSATLHLLNSTQEELLDKTTQVSMLDLMKISLALKSEIESDRNALSSLETWQKSILEKEKEAVLLLQARAAFPVAMALSRISDINSKDFFGLKAVIFKLNNLFLPWHPDFKNNNLVQIESYCQWISLASEAKSFLKKLNYPVPSNKSMDRIILNMNRNIPSSQFMTKEKNTSIHRFFNLLDCYEGLPCR